MYQTAAMPKNMFVAMILTIFTLNFPFRYSIMKFHVSLQALLKLPGFKADDKLNKLPKLFKAFFYISKREVIILYPLEYLWNNNEASFSNALKVLFRNEPSRFCPSFLSGYIILIIFSLITTTNLQAQENDDAFFFTHIQNSTKTYFSDKQKPDDTAEIPELDLVGRWGWGYCLTNVPYGVTGDTLLIGNGTQLQMIDFSNSQAPVMISEIQIDMVYDIALAGSLAYAATYWGLKIVDFSDPLAPCVIGEWTEFGASKIVLADSIAFLANNGLVFSLDIRYPRDIQFLSGAGLGGYLKDMVYYNQYLYVGCYNYGGVLDIFDVSNPANIQPIDFEIEQLITKPSLLVHNDLLFISSIIGILFVYSLEDPTFPALLGQFQSDMEYGNFSAVAARDSILFLCYQNGLTIFNIANPALIFEVGQLDWPWPTSPLFSRKSRIISNRLYLSFGIGVWQVDITTPTFPEHSSYFWTPSVLAWNMKLRDHRLFFPAGESGVWEVDVSNPTLPQTKRHLITLPYAAEYVLLEEDWLYIVADSAVIVADISNPDSMIVRSSWQPHLALNQGVIFNGHLYVGARNGLYVLDINEPTAPLITRHISLSEITAVHVNPDQAVLYAVAFTNDLVYAFSLAEPGQPEMLWTWPAHYASDVITVTPYIYLVHNNSAVFNQLAVLHNDPVTAPPTQINSVPLSGGLFQHGGLLEIKNALLFISNFGYMSIFDISQPANPQFRDGYAASFRPFTVDDNYLYTDGDEETGWGLRIFSYALTGVEESENNSLPEALVINPVYPNPSRESTTISYFLPTQQAMTLTIYNIAGQKIQTLIDAQQPAGEHTVTWDRCNNQYQPVTNGLYLCQLKCGSTTQTRKIVVIR